MRIRRGVGSRRLPCGCLAGIYETYGGHIVTILDAKGSDCLDRDHSAGTVLSTTGLPIEAHTPSE